MPRGDKSSYTGKQKRMAEHIEEGYEKRGTPKEEAERRAWATVNKETGGGNKSGSGRGVPDTNVSSKRGGRIGGPRGGKATLEIAHANRVDLLVVSFDAADRILRQLNRGNLLRGERGRQVDGGHKTPLRFGQGLLPVRYSLTMMLSLR